MSLETRRLTLLPCSAEHLLTLIDRPEHFQESLGLPAADGLRAGPTVGRMTEMQN